MTTASLPGHATASLFYFFSLSFCHISFSFVDPASHDRTVGWKKGKEEEEEEGLPARRRRLLLASFSGH